MNDYLNNLVARTLRRSPVVRPRLPSLFEPLSVAAVHPVSASAQSETFHEDETPTPPASEVSRALPLVKPLLQHPESPKVDTGSRTNTPHTLEPDISKTLESSWTPLSRAEETTLPGAQILTPAGSLTTRAEAHRAGSLSERSTQSPSPKPGTKSSAAEPEVYGSARRSTSETRLIVSNNSPDGPPSSGRRDLLETTAKRALASRSDHSAMRRDDGVLFPTPNEATQFPEPETPQTISVTIGRVDVRAVFPQPQAPRVRRAHPAPMSLDEYLKQRSEGRK